MTGLQVQMPWLPNYNPPPMPFQQSTASHIPFLTSAMNGMSMYNMPPAVQTYPIQNQAYPVQHVDSSYGQLGMIEEKLKVDRDRLEDMLEDDIAGTNRCSDIFNSIMVQSGAYIQWPTKLKSSVKYRKDPYIKVSGSPSTVEMAKHQILSFFDIKSHRITMKMDVSYTDHSFIIGRGGHNIQTVMNETGCHIHFPDSNRTSCKEKSNQVSLSGTESGVEEARIRVRNMLPCTMMVEVIPQTAIATPDSHHPRILHIAVKYGVMVSFREQPLQQPCLLSFMVIVKGCAQRPAQVESALIEIVELFSASNIPRLQYIAQIDISPQHHMFVLGKNRVNVQEVMNKTGTIIQFPEPCHMSSHMPGHMSGHMSGPRRSAVLISGSFYAVIDAKNLLMEYLPIFLMFDVRQDTTFVSDTRLLTDIMEKHSIYISIKPKAKQCCWTVVLKTSEKNTPNLYKGRNDLLLASATNQCAESPQANSPWQSVNSSSRNSPITSQQEPDLSSSLAQLLSPLTKQGAVMPPDYEEKQLMAFNALNEPDFSVTRAPTNIWSGFGFSRSMPASTWREEKEEELRKERSETVTPEPSSPGDIEGMDLPTLLSKHGLSQYLTLLQAQEVDYNTFLTLTEDDLKEIGITSFGAKRKLVLAIQEESKAEQCVGSSILNASNRW